MASKNERLMIINKLLAEALADTLERWEAGEPYCFDVKEAQKSISSTIKLVKLQDIARQIYTQLSDIAEKKGGKEKLSIWERSCYEPLKKYFDE